MSALLTRFVCLTEKNKPILYFSLQREKSLNYYVCNLNRLRQMGETQQVTVGPLPLSQVMWHPLILHCNLLQLNPFPAKELVLATAAIPFQEHPQREVKLTKNVHTENLFANLN